MLSPVRLSVCLSVSPSGTRVDQSKTVELRAGYVVCMRGRRFPSQKGFVQDLAGSRTHLGQYDNLLHELNREDPAI